MFHMKHYLILALCLSLGILNACSTIGVAMRGGDEHQSGVKAAYNDVKIQIAINDLWFQYNVDAFSKLDLTVNSGRVLITGIVQDPEHRVEAVRLAWQPEGVKQVINEIRMDEAGGPVQYAKDAFITGKIRTQMMITKDVRSMNYTIDTVKGTVYLMGLARSDFELDKVKDIASRTLGVKQVVSYVKITG